MYVIFLLVKYVIEEAEELFLLETTELKDMIRKKFLYSTDDRDMMVMQLIQWIDLQVQVKLISFILICM